MKRCFTGFGTGELWTRINNPRWGVDNWIYGSQRGKKCRDDHGATHLDEPVKLGSVCFRFRPDGTAIEPASGRTHGFGQAMDDWGERFLCTNQQHASCMSSPSRTDTSRGIPYYAAPGLIRNISSYGHPAQVYPTSVPDPWRRARAADPAWVRFYGEAEATANGYFTAASGQTIYQADLLPEQYHENHFSVRQRPEPGPPMSPGTRRRDLPCSASPRKRAIGVPQLPPSSGSAPSI